MFLALGLAHVCAAVAFPLAMALAAAVAVGGDRAFEWWHVFAVPVFRFMAAFSFATLAFPFVAVVTLPLSLMTAPLTVAAAAFLRSGSGLTTLYGALAGLLIAGPWARATHGLALSDWGTLLGLAAGGAAFAQPTPALCIRERAPPGDTGSPGRARAWWRRRSLGAKVALCAAAAVLVLFSV